MTIDRLYVEYYLESEYTCNCVDISAYIHVEQEENAVEISRHGMVDAS